MRSVAAFMVVLVLAGVGYAADDLSFVFGGDGVAGKVPAVAAPPCPAESVFAQRGFATTDPWGAYPSEVSFDFVLENFWGVTEEICGIQWWGMFSSPTTGPCDDPDPNFYVVVWDDSGGVVDDFVLQPRRVDTGIDYLSGPFAFRIYEFRATFPYCIELPSGYVTVVGTGDPACWFGWLMSPDGDGSSVSLANGPMSYDFAMCLFTSPSCPSGSLLSQRPNDFDGVGSDADVDLLPGDYIAFENFPPGGGSLDEPICGLRWWGSYADGGIGVCSESEDRFEINFYEDDGGQPGDEVYSYSVVADRQDTEYVLRYGHPVYEFTVDLPSCCPMASGWVSIQGYGGDTDCWHVWSMSVDGDGMMYRALGGTPHATGHDLSLCLATAPDGDGALVPDDFDDCPDTASGDAVDADGCSTADDDGDGVLNDDDLCASTPTCATNVDANGCAIDTDGNGNVDGCEPPPQGCCGATGPVAPLGLAVSMLLLIRLTGYGRSRRRQGKP